MEVDEKDGTFRRAILHHATDTYINIRESGNNPDCMAKNGWPAIRP